MQCDVYAFPSKSDDERVSIMLGQQSHRGGIYRYCPRHVREQNTEWIDSK